MQLFDDLEDFGSFDDVVSGDVRDPYTELARLRREEPVQRIDMSGMPHEESKPVFMVYRHEEVQQMLRDNETFSSAIIIDAFGDVLGKHVMLGMDEPEHGRHRSLVSKAFSQKALARWEDELVGKVGNELIDRFADRDVPSSSRSSRSPTQARSSRAFWAYRARIIRSFSAGRFHFSASPLTPSAAGPPRTPCESTSSRSWPHAVRNRVTI
jgi:hypothetical protein